MPVDSGEADQAFAFVRGFSLEVTRPTVAEIDAVVAHTGRDRSIYLSAVPSQPLGELIKSAALLRRAGPDPVVHLPARRFASAIALQDFLKRLRDEADVRRLMIIAGDVDGAGAFPDALSVIRHGGLRGAGIAAVGIAGYPEGHPRIPADTIEAATIAKIAAADDAGLDVHLVTQFGFSSAPIIGWLQRLRQRGIDRPVRIGLAGPTRLPTLIRYAKRCGVNASIRGLTSGVAAGLIGHVGPERMIAELTAAAGGLGDIAAHYFSFGGVVETAYYAAEIAARRQPGQHAITVGK
jgi:methylenetetrahydrofolate reductase (NADPH)